MSSEREVLTYDLFGTATRELAQEVADSGFRPDMILAIARGGLALGMGLGYALAVKNISVVNVEFYTGVDQRLDVPIMLPPTPAAIDLSGLKVLVADDVADTGRTLELVHAFCEGHVAEARTVVIYEKPQSVIKPDYAWRQHRALDRLPVVGAAARRRPGRARALTARAMRRRPARRRTPRRARADRHRAARGVLGRGRAPDRRAAVTRRAGRRTTSRARSSSSTSTPDRARDAAGDDARRPARLSPAGAQAPHVQPLVARRRRPDRGAGDRDSTDPHRRQRPRPGCGWWRSTAGRSASSRTTGSATTPASPLLTPDPDAIGIDYAIGEPEWVGRGLGARLLWAWMQRRAPPLPRRHGLLRRARPPQRGVAADARQGRVHRGAPGSTSRSATARPRRSSAAPSTCAASSAERAVGHDVPMTTAIAAALRLPAGRST